MTNPLREDPAKINIWKFAWVIYDINQSYQIICDWVEYSAWKQCAGGPCISCTQLASRVLKPCFLSLQSPKIWLSGSASKESARSKERWDASPSIRFCWSEKSFLLQAQEFSFPFLQQSERYFHLSWQGNAQDFQFFPSGFQFHHDFAAAAISNGPSNPPNCWSIELVAAIFHCDSWPPQWIYQAVLSVPSWRWSDLKVRLISWTLPSSYRLLFRRCLLINFPFLRNPSP